MTRAKLDLAPPDINGIGQENVGASQVNLHGGLGLEASWFNTRGVAALVTMRVNTS
jgi:hypothetical protein